VPRRSPPVEYLDRFLDRMDHVDRCPVNPFLFLACVGVLLYTALVETIITVWED
jgi:hypothetical protein